MKKNTVKVVIFFSSAKIFKKKLKVLIVLKYKKLKKNLMIFIL